MTMESTVPAADPGDILEIHDPEIDVEALMAKIRAAVAARVPRRRMANQSGSAFGTDIGEAFLEIQAQMARYGEVGTMKPGLVGKVEIFAKKVLRRLIVRHIRQQQNVNGALIQMVNLLLAELEESKVRIMELEARNQETPKG